MSSDDNPLNDFQKKSSRVTLVDKLTKEIELNLNNDQFGVDSLAQAMSMSRSNLHRKLNKLQGISTSQFIREYRLKRAQEILTLEDITASEAAFRVGFSSATYFSTCFHKFYGYTPREVKSRVDNDVEIPLKSEGQITKTKSKKRTLWLGFAIGVLLISGFYYYTTKKENKDLTKTIENKSEDKSIVVLPFKNWTGNPDLEYISDGMTDAVISRLTKVSALDKVIPFTSTLQYKETTKGSNEIATELGVENLLQGNLQISGNQIKINLQLIDGFSNEHIWSEEYIRDWETDEIFTIQSEVVEGIATHMNAVIATDELTAIKKIPTKDKKAYSYYLQADFQRIKGNELSYSNAIPLYEKAIALDSNFVEPYLDIADIWQLGGSVWGFYDEQTAWKNAKILLEKVLKIEPENRQAIEQLHTGEFFYGWNFVLVENYFQDILENSSYERSSVISLDYPIKTGRPNETLKAVEDLVLKDPSNVYFPFFTAEALFYLGSENEAIETLSKADPLHNDNWFYLRESAKLYYYLGEYEKSKAQLQKILSQFSDYPPILMWLNAVYAQMEGDSENTNRHLTELYTSYFGNSSGSPAWFIALYHAHNKDYEQAFEWLQNSFEKHEVEMTWLREEPLLAPMRNDIRYQELYKKVGFASIDLPIKTSVNK